MAEQEEGEPGEAGSGWRWVPVELTLQVFSWLEPCDLVRAELVCRRWRATIGPTSPRATFFWRTVHKVRFGGARVRPSKEQLRWQKLQREESVEDAMAPSLPASPRGGGGRRKEFVDWRSSCLRCERTKNRLWRRGDVAEMVQWTVTCGHHVLLRHLLATQPVAAIAAIAQRVGWVSRAVRSGSELTVDLVTRHVEVPREALVFAFKLSSSPQAVVDLLVQRFLFATSSRGHQSSPTEADGSRAWHLEQLDETLAKIVTRGQRWSAAKMFVLAGEGEHVGAMALLLDRCATEAARQKLLQTTNRKTNTAFLEACDRRQAKVFALLLPKLSDEQVRDTTGLDNMSALGLALRRGDVAMVRALLGRGARANGSCRESVQPLCLAVSAAANRRKLVDLLLEHGADVNARNRRNGKTCLHVACRRIPLDIGMIGYLLDQGADPGIMAKGWSVMGCLLAEQACPAYGEEKLRAAQLLLARGGSPAGGVGQPGRSLVAIVLRWVRIEGRFDQRSEENVIRMLDLLLAHGFSIHSEPIDTLAPLVGCSAPSIIRHLAATQDLKAVLGDAGGRVAVLAPVRRVSIGLRNRDNMRELFAVLGVRLDTSNPLPPVHLPHVTLELLTEMVKHGADINARDSSGQTIAHRCVLESRSAPSTGQLLAWQRLGLDFSLRDARGRTPAEAYREWRAGLRSNPYYTYQQDQVQRVLDNLQAECQAARPP